MSNTEAIDRAIEELEELRSCPGDINELGDTLAILIHYAVRNGWRMEDVDRAVTQKLHERFHIP